MATKYQCDDCGHICGKKALKVKLVDIPDLNQRLNPGGEVPAGECPKCESLT